MVVKMKIAVLSVLLLWSLCQAFPATRDTETKSSFLDAVHRCCEKFHLAGENSIFKNVIVATGTDYKPPPKACRGRCCHSKRPVSEDTQQNPAVADTKVSDQITAGVLAAELGNAQAQHGLVPDMDGPAESSGVTTGVDGGTGVSAAIVDGGGNGGVDCGGCAEGTAACLCQSVHIFGQVLDFFCCRILCCCCNYCCGDSSGSGCSCPGDCG